MEVEGCEEKTLTFNSPGELRQAIAMIQTVLEGALKEKKPGKEQAKAWTDTLRSKIEEADSLLKFRGQYPELEDVFAKLKATAGQADDDRFDYGVKMRLSEFVG